MGQDISFGISGENAEFMRALKESQEAVTSAAEGMKGSFESIAGIFEKVTGALGLFSAALAGGAAFKEAVDATVELTVGAEDLGRQFGISATQASILRVALDDAHVSTETFSAAGNAMTRQLNQHEEAFKAAGVATRDSGGELRNQLDIMLDAIDHLAKLKEGTDRNVEGQRLFGRAWGEMGRIVQVTSERLREAGEKADALGLAVGSEQVTSVDRYRAAMNDVKDVMTGLMNVIGQAVMPVLTTLGEWFGSIGPGLVETFRIAVATVATPFRVLALLIEVFYETGKGVFTQLAQYALTFTNVLNKAIHGDFSGAAQAWRDGMANIEKIGSDYWNKIAKDAADTQDKIVNSFAEAIVGPKVTPIASPSGGGNQDDEAARKRAMEILREQIRLEDQYQQLQLKGIETSLTNSELLLSGEQRSADAYQREIALIKQKFELQKNIENLQLKQIESQLNVSELFLKNEERAAQRFQQQWGAAFRNIATSFGNAFGNMLRGGLSFGEAMRGMFASIAEAAVENAARNIATMALQSAFGKGLRSQEIRQDAGAAAAGAYKAIVGIPYIGPFLAPAAAAVAYAGVLAFDSAAGGYDIPSGVNPVTQLHQNEMVLPEKYANVIRDQADGRGGGSRPIHIHAKSGSDNLTVDQAVKLFRQAGLQFKLV